MVKEVKVVDISGAPDMLRIAEEVDASGQAEVLRRGDQDIAKVIPLRKKRSRRRVITEADIQAFLSTAGAWKDVDADALLRDIYEDRRNSDRRHADL